MKVTEAIKALESLAQRFGNVDVFFDCPKCGTAFKPSYVATAAVHFSSDEDREEDK